MELFKYALENNLSLLQKNIEYIGIKDQNSKTLLHYAVLGGANDVIDYLLNQDFNVNTADKYGETPLFDCARKGKLLIAKKLISKYAKVDLLNNKGETVLHLACHKGDLDMVKLFIEKGASLNQLTNESKLPIHYAILAGHLQLVIYLMDTMKLSWYSLDEYKNNFLHYASKTTNIKLIELFISNDLDVNQLNDHFETPLFNAVKFGTVETVKLLLKNDAYIDIRNNRFETPLDLAKINHDNQMHQLLETYYHEPTYQKLKEEQALTIAVLNRDYQTLKQLIDRNFKLKKDRYKQTALDYANKYKLTVCINLLRPLI